MSCLGGRDVLKRSALMCKELFPGLIYSAMSLVRSYMSTINLSGRDIDSLLTLESMHQ